MIDEYIATHGATRCPTRYAEASEQAAIDSPVIIPYRDRRGTGLTHGGNHWRDRRHWLFKNTIDMVWK